MLRIPLAAAALLAASASGFAQTTGPIALPVVGAKHAGTYDLATGACRQGASSGARAWNTALFDNTCHTGWYSPHAFNRRAVDDGRIPSTTSPTNPGPPYTAISWTGTQNRYTVGYFELGYCTFNDFPTIEVNFWECFSGCQDSTLITPLATFQLTNMPGMHGSWASAACWTIGIDLTNASMQFDMNADCDGQWDGGGPVDTFGWSWQQVTPSTGGTAGPYIAGDPAGYLNGGYGSSGCDVGASTVFYNGSDLMNTQGSGLDGMDLWEEDVMTPTPAFNACPWYGGYVNGNLYASFHLEIEQGWSPHEPPGFEYCPGDGIAPHTPCPCGNVNDGSLSPAGGCFWGDPGFPAGGVLTATGDSIFANPNVTLAAYGVANNFGIFFGASNATNGGNGNPLNDGLRCAGGGLIRLTAPTMASGNAATHGPVEVSDAGAMAGITRRYQYWFRTPNGPCGQMANLTNGYEISWL